MLAKIKQSVTKIRVLCLIILTPYLFQDIPMLLVLLYISIDIELSKFFVTTQVIHIPRRWIPAFAGMT